VRASTIIACLPRFIVYRGIVAWLGCG